MRTFALCVTVLAIWLPLEKHLIEAISINMEESSGCGDFWERKHQKFIDANRHGWQVKPNISECIQTCTDIASCIAVQVYTHPAGIGCLLYTDYLRTEWSDTSNLYFKMEHCGGKKCHLVEHRNTQVSTNSSLAKYDENEEQACYNNCTLNTQCFVAMHTLKGECLLYDALRQAAGATRTVDNEKNKTQTWLKICEDENTEVYDPCQPPESCSFTFQRNATRYNKVIETLYVIPKVLDQLVLLCKRGCLDNPACVGFYVYGIHFCQWFSANAPEYEVTYLSGWDAWNLECDIPQSEEYCDFNQDSNAVIDEILEIETLTLTEMCKRECLNTTGCAGFTEGVSTCTLFSEISVTKEELDNGDADGGDGDASSESADGDLRRAWMSSMDADSAYSTIGDRAKSLSGSKDADSDDSADGDGGRYWSGSESADSADGDGGRGWSGSKVADSGDSADVDGGRHKSGSESSDSDEGADGDGSRDCRCSDSANSAEDEGQKKPTKFPDIWHLECDLCSASLPVD